MRLRLFWIESYGTPIVLYGLLNVFNEVESIAKVVVNICQLWIQIQSLAIEVDSLMRPLRVIIGISEADKCLELFLIHSQRLLVVSDGLLSMPGLEQQVPHAHQSERKPAIDQQGILQMLRTLLILFAIKVQYPHLCVRLVMFWVQVLHDLKQWCEWSILVIRVLLQGLTQPEICIDDTILGDECGI